MNLLINTLVIITSITLSFSTNALNMFELISKAPLQNIRFDTAVIDAANKNFNADISFLFIDFKYDNHIKICEFGRAKTSGLGDTAIKILVNNTPTRMYAPFWPLFWEYLLQLDMPIWFVGIQPRDHKKATLSEHKNNAWDEFIKIGGHYHSSFEALEQDPLFNKQTDKKPFNATNLHNYKGIIICNPQPSEPIDIDSFKKNHPHYLFLDEVGSKYGRYKHMGASLFEDSSLQMYKPRWNVFPKKYTSTLADQVIESVQSDIFVIKPIGALFGKGVIMIDKQDLDVTLKYICRHDESLQITQDTYETSSQTYSYWKDNEDDIFLVEAYCPSTPIMRHNKFYDPTFRIYFALRHDAGKIFVDIFGGYLKVPVKGLLDEGTLTEKHKTVPYFKSKVGLSAISIPNDLFKKMSTELKIALPKIYHKMLEQHQN